VLTTCSKQQSCLGLESLLGASAEARTATIPRFTCTIPRSHDAAPLPRLTLVGCGSIFTVSRLAVSGIAGTSSSSAKEKRLVAPSSDPSTPKGPVLRTYTDDYSNTAHADLVRAPAAEEPDISIWISSSQFLNNPRCVPTADRAAQRDHRQFYAKALTSPTARPTRCSRRSRRDVLVRRDRRSTTTTTRFPHVLTSVNRAAPTPRACTRRKVPTRRAPVSWTIRSTREYANLFTKRWPHEARRACQSLRDPRLLFTSQRSACTMFDGGFRRRGRLARLGC